VYWGRRWRWGLLLAKLLAKLPRGGLPKGSRAGYGGLGCMCMRAVHLRVCAAAAAAAAAAHDYLLLPAVVVHATPSHGAAAYKQAASKQAATLTSRGSQETQSCMHVRVASHAACHLLLDLAHCARHPALQSALLCSEPTFLAIGARSSEL
jgi:hypothetical protein